MRVPVVEPTGLVSASGLREVGGEGTQMFGKRYAADVIGRSAETPEDRRRFLRSAGVTGLGVIGASALSGGSAVAEQVQEDASRIGDASVLNFALNLEYLEAQFYLHAVTGSGLPDKLTSGKGDRGHVRGGRRVHFESKMIREYAHEIAHDELAHVRFLRAALGNGAVAQPQINLKRSFTLAAQAAGLVKPGQSFDAFANEANFLLAAFLFEDVGVTAYKGAAPLIKNKTYLEAAAGILATEAYHAANIRTSMFGCESSLIDIDIDLGGIELPIDVDLPDGGKDLVKAARKLSNARDSLDGKKDLDQGIVKGGDANIVPTDKFGVTYSRSAAQVLNIVYLTPKKAKRGGFFPKGVNGKINTSAANG